MASKKMVAIEILKFSPVSVGSFVQHFPDVSYCNTVSMSNISNAATDSNLNQIAFFGHIAVALWQNNDFLPETLNPVDAPDTNSKIVDLAPGEFKVYIAISQIPQTIGNLTSFTIDISGARVAQLCVPYEEVAAKDPYIVFLESTPDISTSQYLKFRAPDDAKEVRVTASCAKGGLQNMSEEGVNISLQHRKKDWMLAGLDRAAERRPGGVGNASDDPVRWIPQPAIEMLGQGMVYKFKIGKLEGGGRKMGIDTGMPRRREPFIMRA